jgi:hypothetical protein
MATESDRSSRDPEGGHLERVCACVTGRCACVSGSCAISALVGHFVYHTAKQCQQEWSSNHKDWLEHIYYEWNTRLRNICSSLNADLHLINWKPSAAYICGHGFEDFYNENIAILFIKLENYVQYNWYYLVIKICSRDGEGLFVNF